MLKKTLIILSLITCANISLNVKAIDCKKIGYGAGATLSAAVAGASGYLTVTLWAVNKFMCEHAHNIDCVDTAQKVIKVGAALTIASSALSAYLLNKSCKNNNNVIKKD